MSTRQRPRQKRQRKRPYPQRRKKPGHINIGLAFFGIIFLYLAGYVYAHLTSSKIAPYEVRSGSLTVDNTCTGVILREETIVNAEEAGYIKYYIRSGEKVSTSSNVYALSQSEQIDSLIGNTEDYAGLDANNLIKMQNAIEAYEGDITQENFYNIYNFKIKMDNTLISLLNEQLLDQTDELIENEMLGIHLMKAPIPGVAAYYIDGFEEVKSETFNDSMFEQEEYTQTDLSANALVAVGDPVYKLVTEEDWKIIIPLTETQITELIDKNSIKIRFLKNDLVTTAGFEIMSKDGKSYGVLKLSNYMVEFIEDRYVEIELMSDKIEGLKVPLSAVTEKQFYVVPEEFLTQGGDNNEDGFLKETYMPDGSSSVVFVPTTIYETRDQKHYVDCSDFNLGDYLVKENSEERYQIGAVESLKGVYNINRGYAVFRKINVLYESDEYCIIEQGTPYGVAIYDHIVLDSKAVKEDEIINQN